MFVFVVVCIFCVHSSFAIILKRKKKLVALLLLSYRCIVTINVLCLFLTVPWVGLQYVIVVFPDHTYLHFLVLRTIFFWNIVVPLNNFASMRNCPWMRSRSYTSKHPYEVTSLIFMGVQII